MQTRSQSVASILGSAVLIVLLLLLGGCGGGTLSGGNGGGGGGGGGGSGGGGGGPNVAFPFLTQTTGDNYQINLWSSTGVTPVGSPDMWTSVRLSPDAKKIVFSLYSSADGYQIGVMNADGSGKTILTTTSGIYPVFTPDDTKILYQSYPASGNYDLILMNADGSDPINLTNQDGTNYWNPVISPDGKTIAVVVAGANSGLATMNIDGSGFNVIAQDSDYYYWPAFSADGSKIFVSYHTGWIPDRLVVIDIDGTNLTPIKNTFTDVCPMVVGNKVLSQSPPASQTGVNWSYSEIYAMNPDGSGITRLTNNSVYDGFFAIVPR